MRKTETFHGRVSLAHSASACGLWFVIALTLLLAVPQPWVKGAESPIDPADIPQQIDWGTLPAMTPTTIFTRDDRNLKMIDIEAREVRGYIDVSLSGYRPIVIPYNHDEVFAYATEMYHRRGTRGGAEVLMASFGYDGFVREEVMFPQAQMVSVDISDDGNSLYYYSAVDETIWRLDTRTNTLDEPVWVGPTCGADVFAVGTDTVFTSCWRHGEMVEVDFAGPEPVVTRHKVFPPGTKLYRLHAHVRDANDHHSVYLFSMDSEVIPIRFDDEGNPLPAEAISLYREGEIIAPRGNGYAISPDGKKAFVSYRDGDAYKSPGERIRVFDTTTWEELFEITLVDPVTSMAVTLDGRWLVTTGNGRFSIFDAETYHFRGFYEDVSPRTVWVPKRVDP